MGDTKLFYSPIALDGGYTLNPANLETITIPRGSTLCDFDLTGDADLPVSGTGRSFAAANMRGVTVSISANLGNDLELAEACMALVSFAKEGGLVGFALDSDYAFFAQLTTEPNRGDTTFDYGVNTLIAWGGPATPADGWRLYVSSGLPQMRREMVKIESVAGTVVTIVDPFTFTYDPAGLTIVRHKYFFPFLKYVSGDVVMSQPQTGTYRFDCVFKVDQGVEQLPIDPGDISEEVEVDPETIFWTDAEGGDSVFDLLDIGDYAGACAFTADTQRTDAAWSRSPTYAIVCSGSGGFTFDESFTGFSELFQLGVDPDFWIGMWISPVAMPGPGDYSVLFEHSNGANSYCALRINGTGKFEWVKRTGGSETIIVATTTVYDGTTPAFVLLNMHAGVTSIGWALDGDPLGTWEDSDPDSTDYDQFHTIPDPGTVYFLCTGSNAGGGGGFTNLVGLADDIKARVGAYWSGDTVGNTFPTPATAP